MRIDSSGRVGIGTSSPAYLLDIGSNTAPAVIRLTNNNYDEWILQKRRSDDTQIVGLKEVNSGGLALITNNNERMRIDSSGNVGIGTSSPAFTSGSGLEIERDSNNSTIRLQRTGASPSSMELRSGANTGEIFVTSGSPLLFATSGTERMRIDSSGNVGIGTSSPERLLHIFKGESGGQTSNSNSGIVIENSGNTYLQFLTPSSAESGILFGDDDNDRGVIAYNHNGDYFSFRTNGVSDRMRIDSSGNLLVGKTSASTLTVGVEARPDGTFAAVKSGGASVFGRTTSDGDILGFRKDGTTVGSIGSEGGDSLYIVNGDTGLRFVGNVDSIVPSNANGAARDAAIDIGFSSQRFKDLYLSGGVYLGGTGAANYLDDYEEGTCNITIQDSAGNSATMGTKVCRYTKVGNLVFLTGTLSWTSTSSLAASSRIKFTGLPFTTAASTTGEQYRTAAHIGPSSSGSFTIPREDIASGVDANVSFAWGTYVTGNNLDGGLNKSHLGSSGIIYGFTITYQTS